MAKKKKKTTKKQVKKTEKKVVEPKKPGVIASILEFVQKGPISKKQILGKLKQRFPDRPVEGMEKTINAQLPNRMSREKGIKIVRDKDGNFFVKK